MSNDDDAFVRRVTSKANAKLRAQRAGAQTVWFGLGMLGVIGWSVTVPTLLGALLGLWVDRRHPGPHSWTLALLVVGLVLGCSNAWRWVANQDKTMRKQADDT